MNLHAMVRGIVGQVNPTVTAFLWKSKGYKTGVGARQIPEYLDRKEINLQVQSADGFDLTHIDFTNIQGERKVVYADNQLYGIDRERNLGGDLLEFYGRKWLVVKRLEGWEGSDWCRVLVVAQLDKVEDETDGINDYDNRP